MVKMNNVTPKETDAQVKRMIDTWDIVKCKICKKKISMLDARIVNGGEYFVCKNGH